MCYFVLSKMYCIVVPALLLKRTSLNTGASQTNNPSTRRGSVHRLQQTKEAKLCSSSRSYARTNDCVPAKRAFTRTLVYVFLWYRIHPRNGEETRTASRLSPRGTARAAATNEREGSGFREREPHRMGGRSFFATSSPWWCR